MPVHRFIRLPNLDKVIDILVAYTANKDRKKLCIIKRKILKFTGEIRVTVLWNRTGSHRYTNHSVALQNNYNYAITIKAVNGGNNIKTHKTRPNMGVTSFCNWSTFSKKKKHIDLIIWKCMNLEEFCEVCFQHLQGQCLFPDPPWIPWQFPLFGTPFFPLLVARTPHKL